MNKLKGHFIIDLVSIDLTSVMFSNAETHISWNW